MAATPSSGAPLATKASSGPEPMPISIDSAASACCTRGPPPKLMTSRSSLCRIRAGGYGRMPARCCPRDRKRRAEKKPPSVPGASSGVGAGPAVALARHGFDVAVSATRAENLDGTVAQLEALGVQPVVLVL